MKYVVKVPTPKAKRLTKCVLMVSKWGGFDGGGSGDDVYEPLVFPCDFVFEVPDDIPHKSVNTLNDGDWFEVSVEFTNPSRTRRESYELKPESYE